MNGPAIRCMRLMLALCAAMLLCSCTAIKFAYNNAEGVIRLAAWDYLDLEDEQEDAYKLQIAKYMDWHRREEMPVYARLAGEAADRLARRISADDVTWAIAQGRTRYRAAAARAARESAPVLATLTESQLAVLRKRLTRSNLKFEKEFLAGDESRRHKARRKRMIGNIEDWTGDLTTAQEARVDKFVRDHPRSSERRYAERLRWQAELLGVLRANRDPEALAAKLVLLFSEPERGRSEEYTVATRRWEADLAQMMVELDATLSAEQRRRAINRIAGFASDFRDLAGDAPPRPQARLD